MSEMRAVWLSFFRNAGIPQGFDTKYAVIFDENRIRKDMLMDITKECLRDMGITAMGDIIAILKHARKVHDESKEEDLETLKPSSTVSKVIVKETSSKSPAQSTTTPKSTISAVKTAAVTIQRTTANKVGASAPPKSSVVARSLTTKSTTSQKITSSTSSVIRSSAKASPSVITSEDELPIPSYKDDISFMKKKVVVNLRSDSDSSALKEEVPLQKKIRVLPEHEGGYKIKMPEGTTPKTKKLLQARLGPSFLESLKEKKPTVFDRLGESKVSSTCDGNKTTTSPILTSKKPAAATTDDSKDSDSKSMSSARKGGIFSRLGNKNNPTQSAPPPIQIDKSMASKKFEIRQSLASSSSSSERSPIITLTGAREKSLSDLRPKSVVNTNIRDNRNVRNEERFGPGSSFKSGMRSDVMPRNRELPNVKARLGLNSHPRSRSRSPPTKKRAFDSTPSQRRSRSPPYSRDDTRNTKRPLSVVTAPAPSRRQFISTKVTASAVVNRRSGDRKEVMKNERPRDTSTETSTNKRRIIENPSPRMTSRTDSQDSFVLSDIEDPLAGCYSESD